MHSEMLNVRNCMSKSTVVTLTFIEGLVTSFVWFPPVTLGPTTKQPSVSYVITSHCLVRRKLKKIMIFHNFMRSISVLIG